MSNELSNDKLSIFEGGHDMQSIRRLYVAKNGVFADEAKRLLTDLQENLLIKGLTDIHIYHRYDVSGLDDAAFEAAKNMI